MAAEWITALATLGCLAFGLFTFFGDRRAQVASRLQRLEDFAENKFGYRPIAR